MDAQQIETLRHLIQDTQIPLADVAKKTGICLRTLYKYAERYNFATNRKTVRITDEISQEIHRRRAAGDTLREISDATGIKLCTIHSHLHRNNTQFQPHYTVRETEHYDYGAALYARREEVCREKGMTDEELTAWINTPRGERYFFGY